MKRREFHGMTDTAVYEVWTQLIQRCTNPSNKSWKWYGGRGVAVCAEWRDSFLAFYEHVGPRPEGMWIERKENSKGYEPGNCKWATPVEQNNNRRPRGMNRNNASGITGVCWQTHGRLFRVQFRNRCVGSSRDFFEACCLRKSTEAKFGL